jgi:hypothetical protein
MNSSKVMIFFIFKVMLVRSHKVNVFIKEFAEDKLLNQCDLMKHEFCMSDRSEHAEEQCNATRNKADSTTLRHEGACLKNNKPNYSIFVISTGLVKGNFELGNINPLSKKK